MTQSVKGLLNQRVDLSTEPQYLHKNKSKAVYPYNSCNEG